MALDTSPLQDWPAPSAINAAAGAIAKQGAAVDTAVGSVATTWSFLERHYEAPEQNDVLTVFRNITPHGEAVKTAAEDAKKALETFSSGVEGLLETRRALLLDVQEFRNDPPRVDPSDPDSEVLPLAEAQLDFRIQDLVYRYQELETACVSAIMAINGGPKSDMGALAGPNFALIPAATGNYGSLYTFKSVEVEAYRTVPVPWQDYRFTPIDPDTLNAAERAGNRFLRIDGREISVHDPEHPDYGRTKQERYWRTTYGTKMDWRPEVNKKFYDRFDWYSKKVDADRSNWKPDLSASERPRFSQLPNELKGIKAGGLALGVVMAGVTFADERAKEYNNLLQENPSMSESDREFRANEVGTVKTAAKTTVDLGAGLAGAAVGTAIGGPVGTVVGFGVGMFVSYASDVELPDWLGGKSIKDQAADGAVELYDGAKDLVSDGWNAVFG